VTFSLDAVPHLVRPGTHDEWDDEDGKHFAIDTPPRDELWFEAANVTVDVQPAWWVYLVDALGALLTFMFGPLLVEAFIDMARDEVSDDVADSADSQAARVQEFTLTGIPTPKIRMTIVTWEPHVEGIFTGINLRPQFGAALLGGPREVAAEDIRTAGLRFGVTLPFDAHPKDPELSVHWTVRRTDMGAPVLTIEGQANTKRALDLTHAPAVLQAPEFRVECRVFRTQGAKVKMSGVWPDLG
jgi:hypothetical protein